jgi:arabinofuranan 3-O-arabinosyltransferase
MGDPFADPVQSREILRSLMQPKLSIVLPFYRQAGDVAEIVKRLQSQLFEIGLEHEFLLVPNGPDDGTRMSCTRIAATMRNANVVVTERAGWGAAVRAGIASASGDLICYTNSARTQPGDFQRAVIQALGSPDRIVKAVRPARESRVRRLGSLLFNIECNFLFNINSFDVNGTPKIFPKSFVGLSNLTRSDDLLDLEFMWVCRRFNYPIVEFPIAGTPRFSGRSTTDYMTALRLYWAAFRMWQDVKTRRSLSSAAN